MDRVDFKAVLVEPALLVVALVVALAVAAAVGGAYGLGRVKGSEARDDDDAVTSYAWILCLRPGLLVTLRPGRSA